ncbi:cyclin-D3-1-like [Arachis stenosperma]|uniref:cyclin-D3-1-like n=1 Tax=Arachis stenosperma TaxID=217475 RepID=UPI0025ABCCD8|nr:cyclin-D3-1-like [Arachis stenosperma]
MNFLILFTIYTYLDRFLLSFHFQREKPWMIQLASVTCISLAAKVEETQVPLLLDLQVEDAKYVFEAKIIQKMELLILSTLNWKMYPVILLSFLDHIIRRLGLKIHLYWQFLKRRENLLLSLLLDSRFVGCLPFVLATATMLNIEWSVRGDSLRNVDSAHVSISSTLKYDDSKKWVLCLSHIAGKD